MILSSSQPFLSRHTTLLPQQKAAHIRTSLGRGVRDETKTAVRKTRNDPGGLQHHLLWRDGEYFSLSVFSGTLS